MGYTDVQALTNYALFFYAHDSAYYSSIPAYYSNLIFQYAHEECITKFNHTDHNRDLYLVSQRWFLPINRKSESDKTDKKSIGQSR